MTLNKPQFAPKNLVPWKIKIRNADITQDHAHHRRRGADHDEKFCNNFTNINSRLSNSAGDLTINRWKLSNFRPEQIYASLTRVFSPKSALYTYCFKLVDTRDVVKWLREINRAFLQLSSFSNRNLLFQIPTFAIIELLNSNKYEGCTVGMFTSSV